MDVKRKFNVGDHVIFRRDTLCLSGEIIDWRGLGAFGEINSGHVKYFEYKIGVRDTFYVIREDHIMKSEFHSTIDDLVTV